jgi:hypothetical protein
MAADFAGLRNHRPSRFTRVIAAATGSDSSVLNARASAPT